jgi:glutamate racemase
MIGVFDSGLGGLSVFKELIKALPEYNYIYLGDNARLPYGDKSPKTVYQYTCEAIDFLVSQKCQLIIIACNTATSLALRKIQQEYLPKKYPNIKVLGVVRPLAEYAASSKNKKIAVIGTKGTINSRAYEKEIKKLNPEKKIKSIATPLLVPIIEEGWQNKKESLEIIKNYLKPINSWGAEELILGCTHYPFILNKIKRLTKKTKIVNPGKIVALSLKDYLIRHTEIKISQSKKAKQLFFVSDKNNTYKKLAERFLGKKISHLTEIKL